MAVTACLKEGQSLCRRGDRQSLFFCGDLSFFQSQGSAESLASIVFPFPDSEALQCPTLPLSDPYTLFAALPCTPHQQSSACMGPKNQL